MTEEPKHDFVIVGSGAGGGPLAANLALAGFKVLLIEAGDDKVDDNYSVPAFHPLSTEDPLLSWEFFVKHYDNNPERDPKYHHDDPHLPGVTGIFYPRATGLGGCTTHHAMITVCPHDGDWDAIAAMVGDPGWNAANMRKYFERVVRAEYRDRNGLLKVAQSSRDPGGSLFFVEGGRRGGRAHVQGGMAGGDAGRSRAAHAGRPAARDRQGRRQDRLGGRLATDAGLQPQLP